MKNISLILNNQIKQLIAKDMATTQKSATANLISHFNAQTPGTKEPIQTQPWIWTVSLDRHK